MKYYLAPMEGITGYIYRNAYHRYFEDFDKYFLPFIAPHTNRSYNARERNDLLPEHNEGMSAVPQILTNHAGDFLRTAGDLQAMGYTEVNLNLGCPSGTVVAKGRGSGFLDEPQKLDEFFERIFEKATVQISVKTRVGKDSPAVFEELLDIFNKYPIKELIVHPRIQKDFYKNTPRMDCIETAVEKSRNPLCYNGDLFTAQDYENFHKAFPTIEYVMLGRGVIANPGLLGEIKSGQKISRERLREFHDRLYCDYRALFGDDRNALFKMKEVWSYLAGLFEDSSGYAKKIKKSGNHMQYKTAVDALFQDCRLR